MKNFVTFLLLLISLTGCYQNKQPIKGETEFQKKLNAYFKDASKSPLKTKDRKIFEGLDFFKFDANYIVKARFKKLHNEKPFAFATTTQRLDYYLKFGELTFELRRIQYKLYVYQNLELSTKEGYEDYLFLPFLDATNGMETYGGGRYIDARIPKGDTLEIDFNKAYNPYCAYNETYSCPLVPRENYLNTKIQAGVKAYKKH